MSVITVWGKNTGPVNTIQKIITGGNFSGGEVNIRLDKEFSDITYKEVTVTAQITDSDGILSLLMVKDALDNAVGPDVGIQLHLPYVPYGRQDRVCNEGEALGVKVMAGLINSMNFDTVVIADPHSDVTPALIDRCVLLSIADIFSKADKDFSKYTLVAPDAGAAKKVQEVAKSLGGPEVIQGIKHRDTATGALSGFDYIGNVAGRDLLIIDDICDGGGTFIGLAKELMFGGARSITLYVTHGIFSKGIDLLLDNGIDSIITTNCWPREEDDRLEIILW